ncbi:MAG TPA: hypothetical protein PLU72_18830 [Candidatus Ozemobacteraceae bacterium]|nr:hypothetical protein [Candidatus Ozemobacteraceae bacterium]
MRRATNSRRAIAAPNSSRNARRKVRFPRTGAILIVVVCGAALFLGLLALVTDIGWTYYHQLKLQTAINAGWKAGFDELLALRATSGEPVGQARFDRVAAHVRSVVALNYPDAPPPEVTVTFGKPDPDTPTPALDLTVFGSRNVPLFFANMFGISFFRVQSIRSSESDFQMDPGIIPIAIPHGEVKEPHPGLYQCALFSENEGFVHGKEYLLHPGTSFVNTASSALHPDPGLNKIQNTGAIDPDNKPRSGDTEFAGRLRNGFQLPLQIHDRIILQPGIPPDTTASMIAAHIASGTTRAIFPITDIPPEVASAAANLGARTIYDLKGLDSPDGAYSPAEYSFTAAIRIIGFAEFELTNPGNSGHGQIHGRFLRYIIKPGGSVIETTRKMGSE